MQRTRWTNGLHQLEFQKPDILIIHLGKRVVVDEVKESIRIIDEEVAPEVGLPFYFVHITSGLASFDSEVRKYLSTLKPRWKAAVIIGGNAVSRAAANVGLRAMNLLTGSDTPMRMVKDFEDAYAYANEIRAAEQVSAGKK